MLVKAFERCSSGGRLSSRDNERAFRQSHLTCSVRGFRLVYADTHRNVG